MLSDAIGKFLAEVSAGLPASLPVSMVPDDSKKFISDEEASVIGNHSFTDGYRLGMYLRGIISGFAGMSLGKSDDTEDTDEEEASP
jgi:hypothetical protein